MVRKTFSGEAKSGAFFGWRVMWAAFVLAILGWGVGFYGPPIFLHAVVQRTGWSVALVSGAVTFHFLTGAVVVANLSALYARFGLPVITSAGALLLSVGVFGWAACSSPWQLFLAAALSGTGWVTMGAAAVNAIIAPWFVRKRPAALSTAYNGASVGGAILSPLWVFLIGRVGFVTGALLIGAVTIVVVWCLARFVFAKRPDVLGQHADGEAPGEMPEMVSQAGQPSLAGGGLWRDRRFRTLAGGMALGLFAQIGLIAHLFSILVPVLGEQTAGFAMGLATLSAIAGRTSFGWFMPAGADRRRVASLGYVIQIAGSLVLMVFVEGSPGLVIVGVLLFGFGIGNATSLPPLIAQAEFANDDVQRVVPLIVAIGQASYAFAPAVFGVLRAFGPDAVGVTGPVLVFALAAFVQVLSIVCFLRGRG